MASLLRRAPRGRYRYLAWLPASAPFAARFPPAPRLRFTCDLRDAISREVYFAGSYEPQQTRLVDALVAPGAIAVDVGANWGYFTLLMAERAGPGGRVVSLEPEPRLFTRLRDDVCANALAWVQCVQAAAAEGDGEVWLQPYGDAPGNWGVSRIARPGNGLRVRARGLDRLLDAERIARVDVVKIDVEGAESGVLRGMAAGLARQRYRTVLLEWHPSQMPPGALDAARRLFAEAGYEGWLIDHSKAATHRAAYRGEVTLKHGGHPLDDWPHALFVCRDDIDDVRQRLSGVVTFR